MVAVIIIAILVWLASAAIRSARYTRHDHAINRIQAAQEKADRERREETARRLQMEHEIAKHAHELEKHEAWLRKHDEEIKNLTRKLNQVEDDVEHWKLQLGRLYNLLSIAEENMNAATVGGKDQIKYQKQVVTLTNHVHNAEKKYTKALQDREDIMEKMEVA